MTNLQVTPSFLIEFMNRSRNLSKTEMMQVIDTVRKHPDALFTAEDVDKLFSSSKDTLVSKPSSESDVFAETDEEMRSQVAELLSNYLSSIDQNFTDSEVSRLYYILLSVAAQSPTFNAERLVGVLVNQIKKVEKDMDNLSVQEIESIVEQQPVNEWGTRSLIENWPDQPKRNVFDESTPVSTQSSENEIPTGKVEIDPKKLL